MFSLGGLSLAYTNSGEVTRGTSLHYSLLDVSLGNLRKEAYTRSCCREQAKSTHTHDENSQLLFSDRDLVSIFELNWYQMKAGGGHKLVVAP